MTDTDTAAHIQDARSYARLRDPFVAGTIRYARLDNVGRGRAILEAAVLHGRQCRGTCGGAIRAGEEAAT